MIGPMADAALLLAEMPAYGPALARRVPQIVRQIVQIGLESLPVIVVATGFAGLITTDEIAWHMNRALSTVVMIPGVTGQFILRELGVAIPAFILVSRVGASITAEVATMKITDQIDALKLLGINPVEYLVFPRFIAAIIAGACLALIASAITLAYAMFVAVFRYQFMGLEYLSALRNFVGIEDLFCTVVKGMVYGGIIPLISCAYGFRCKGGAEGVGSATTDSVVASTLAVIVLDFIITWLFNQMIGG